MLTGRRFKLERPTLAIDGANGKRQASFVPAGAVVKVVSGPTSAGDRMVDVLWDGKIVIADRFLFTGLARDVARGLDLDWVLRLYQPLLWPDLVFYFAVSADTSGRRVTARTFAPALTSSGPEFC